MRFSKFILYFNIDQWYDIFILDLSKERYFFMVYYLVLDWENVKMKFVGQKRQREGKDRNKLLFIIEC